MASEVKRQPRFEIDASVIYELGEKLISDEVQALVELVKNSYDADASYANVTVGAEELVGDNSLNFSQSRGYIIIEDDGIGMDWNDIERGWLTISASPKREMKAKGRTTKKGRTPLGDKGLGRLGSQRLGQRIEIWTSEDDSNVEYYVGVDWGDFRDSVLSKVPVHFEEQEKERPRKGTRIVISGLRSPEEWKGTRRDELVSKLAQLLFPFEELRPFDVFLTVNGARMDLDRISKSVFDVADARFTFSFDGHKLHIEGKYRLSILLATTKGEHAKQQFQRLVAPDQGADFYAYLTETYLSQDGSRSIPGLKWEDEPGWFVSFEESHSLEDCGDIELVSAIPLGVSPSEKDLTGEIANPGPFRGVIYSFKRKGTDLSAISDVFNIQSEFSDYVERHSGIRVFRNGFGVRPFGLGDNDWLQLGSGWTSAISYYGLRPKNVVGYVALTARDNSKLEEATDREGFVENAHLRNFYLLMQRVVKSITPANTNLRRGYTKYAELEAKQELGITSQSVSEIFTQMRDTSSGSRELGTRVAKTRDSLESVYTRVKTLTQAIESTPLFHTEQEREVAPLLQEIKGTLNEAASILRQVESMLSQAKHLGESADVLEPDLEHLREELEMFSELAGLGMTAEALSHEMSIIADGLAARTRSLLAKFKRRKSPDSQIVAYTEHVHTAVGRMRKQLGHLDPSMRYVRERRDKIEMRAFFENICDFYSERLARNNIEMAIEEPFEDFTILMNKGKLTQVIDNLLLNSEYWLKEDLRKSHISTAQVLIRAKAPMIEIYDTGRGVAPSVEHYLFQPFVTMKPQGRGLGLFIARQLLNSSGCSISLLPERNQFDRRYIFRVDLTGAVVNE